MTATDQKLDELKGKYSAAFRAIDQQGISLSHVHIQDNKLYIAGTANSDDAKNKVWDAIKQTNPSWQSEVICDITVDQQAATSNTGQTSVQPDQQYAGRTYTVKPGDSLSKIAQELYGKASDYNKIFEANRDKLTDANKIQPGQVLNIP